VTAPKRIAPLAAAGSLLMGWLVWVGPATATPQKSFAVVNGTADSTAEQVVFGSSAFINYTSGAVDNYYPLAHAHVDNAPFAEGTASLADTGPFGQTAASQASFHQPQYAEAKSPGGPSRSQLGSSGGPDATASVTVQTAQAAALVTNAPAGPATGAGLRPSLQAWRAEWLDAADAARYPMPAGNQPDGTSGDSATSVVTADAGVVHVTGSARVDQGTFAGGLVSVSHLRVVVEIQNDGTPRHAASTTVGSITVAGVPVTVDQGGVRVVSTEIPGFAGTAQAASAALNTALAAGGVQITALAPQVSQSTNQATVQAAGLAVSFTQPVAPPGVPRQTVTDVLGVVFADDLAVPAAPPTTALTPVVKPHSRPVASATAPTGAAPTNPSSATTTTTAAAPAQPSTTLPARLVALHRSRPRWLLYLYFLWQSVIVGTVASLWWKRQEVRV
jgi:hypothetical protein